MHSAILSIGLSFAMLAASVNAATLFVDDSNTTASKNGTAKAPYSSIQEAIESAKNGDTIKVALGEYGAITTLGKPLTLLGGYPGAKSADYASGKSGDFSLQGAAHSATIIRGSKNVDAVTFTRFDSEPYRIKLDNFTVRGGRKGIVCDTVVSFPEPTNVTISRSRVENNGSKTTTPGGGILITGRNAVISGNIIRANRGGRGSGVMRVGNDTGKLTIKNNRVTDNTGYDDHGGGMMFYGQVFLTGNTILRNQVDFDYGWGGGFLMHSFGTLRSSNNIVRGNRCPTYGGGVFLDDGVNAVLHNDLIDNNYTITGYGGGVALDDGYPGATHGEFVNCTIVNNNLGFTNPDFGDFGGNGLFLDENKLGGTSAVVTNCIFWGNRDDFFGASANAIITSMTYSISQERFAGEGNLRSNPKFVDGSVGGDFRLKSGSPGIDSGSNQAWMTGAKDLAGKPRIANGTVDRGCYEVQP